MKVRGKQFLEFAFGDKRRDREVVRFLFSEENQKYDHVKDRYKQFREALIAFEGGACLPSSSRPCFGAWRRTNPQATKPCLGTT